jgi:heme-degrading monooxygenase HmoA
MVTYTKTYTLKLEQKDVVLPKLQKLYTEVFPVQLGYLSSQLVVNADGTQVTATSNWEDEEKLIAFQQSDLFQSLAYQVA